MTKKELEKEKKRIEKELVDMLKKNQESFFFRAREGCDFLRGRKR